MTEGLAASIIAKIKTHAAPDTGDITLETDLTQLCIHDLEITEIIFDIEDEFGIEVELNTADAWSQLSNVGDIVEAVRSLIGAKSP